jgi:hypothetical protein
MEKHNTWSSRVQLYVLVLLLASIALNIYQYFNAVEPSSKYVYGSTMVVVDIQGGMGSMYVSTDARTIMGLGWRFNVSVGVKLWEPFTGSATYNFCFRLYERSEQDDKYLDAPIAEKTIIAQKDKDAMYVTFSSGNLTATVPDTRGIHIYKVEFGSTTEAWETFEFPILAEEGMLISPII